MFRKQAIELVSASGISIQALSEQKKKHSAQVRVPAQPSLRRAWNFERQVILMLPTNSPAGGSLQPLFAAQMRF